ncbi:Protein polyglycylase TTLL10 [Geodia barretti]|uniref:Protein polyglycylase TTLL10 n=1 Tax=Geodia barretti TaxID=519541 RepID=A0AA35S8Z8_GEOBA|nr:Protein polyglycylase TTLL10 [Geodia barretti]
MRPGDLVFVSGTYFNEQRKQQRHGMVHVEIWLGDGEKTVGARWQKGRVEIHESYQFVSKSYHSMQYHFRSIDTWLNGICRSYCPEHEWEVAHQFTPGKYSIFSTEQDESCGEEDEEGGGGGGDERGEKEGSGEEDGGRSEATSPPDKVQSLSPLAKCPPVSASGKSVSHHSRSRASARGSARTFAVCGGNAAPLVCEALRSKGWVQLEDTSSTAFTLKWTEISKHINYKEFREGEQIVNHFPNISLLTTKIGLLESLRAMQRLQSAAGARGLRVASFLPDTYRLDREEERAEFTRVYSSGELWICKPTGANQGKGIFLVRDLQQVLDRLEGDEKHCKIASRPTPRIAQRYITPPLLLGGRKFDIRVYMLVVAAQPYVVLYGDGYVRLSCASYNAASHDLTVHLTNQFQQKKHPDYSTMREDTVWDYRKLAEHLTKEHSLPPDWVTSTLIRKMKAIMSTCFQSVRHKLSHRVGFFDLLGFDFMLDSQLNVRATHL